MLRPERGAPPAAEPTAVNRKKALLRLLARAHAEQLGLGASGDEIGRFANQFRGEYGLGDEAVFEAWLAETGLTRADFTRVMKDFFFITNFERRYAAAIDAEVAAQRAVWAVPRRPGGVP